ncbi:MAG: hypothetical protein K8E66_08040, partial [Phycisphaerales bacterium]|nr:hypothetical protein [Phycisphaerales bacterium]
MRSLFGLLIVVAAVVPASGQSWSEVSEDGHTSVALTTPETATGSAARGSTLPFALTPDIQVNLRRQIGGLAIADMNADGLNDLVAVCYSSSSFPPYDDWREMIFYNTPNGLNTTPGWLSDNQTHAGDVQVGDVNGD